MVWMTGSRSSYKVFRHGARQEKIEAVLSNIKWLEKQKRTRIYVVWGFTEPWSGMETERSLGLSTSTDEWGVERTELQEVFKRFGVHPTVDAMANSRNRLCERFFSKYPQQEATAVDFFAQSLEKGEVYF